MCTYFKSFSTASEIAFPGHCPSFLSSVLEMVSFNIKTTSLRPPSCFFAILLINRVSNIGGKSGVTAAFWYRRQDVTNKAKRRKKTLDEEWITTKRKTRRYERSETTPRRKHYDETNNWKRRHEELKRRYSRRNARHEKRFSTRLRLSDATKCECRLCPTSDAISMFGAAVTLLE